ncbi:polyprenyl synthetase family protein [Leucobacter allii]|uniref:Polyprenyl synthetase family protein n=1 Tax=Leucobacter allii TaxID=2932247 RepID=A0ABY4FL44_9MICO|nr:polyprenyl synthetase family protein [Leucobacter allii]UOQ56978.1 polyprenyl synthetase family protein [Leucobacter allii]
MSRGVLTRSGPAALEIEDVQREIDRMLAERGARATAYGAHFARLWAAAAECITGGKLLRPRLLIGTFEGAADGDGGPAADRGAVLRVAAAVELLHYAFLLHDDVIDRDLLRRGRPNLIGTVLRDRDAAAFEGASAGGTPPDPADLHWASTSGILMGDLLLAAVHQVFARERLPEPMRLRLLDLLDHAITESVAGEHLDVALSHGVAPSELASVLDMSRLKTATYTFELPLRAGAVLAGASAETEEAIARLGRHLGVAFQLQDDLLSTFGRAEEHGKDPYSDLREGKETAIIAYARLTEAWPEIARGFGSPTLTAAQGARMRDRLIDCGAHRFLRSLIEEEIGACAELLAAPGAGIPPALAAYIGRLIESIEERRL